MSRQPQKGLWYFPMETAIFSDQKLKILQARFGLKGQAVYIRLLCEIYRDEGYFIKFGEAESFVFSVDTNAPNTLINDIVQECIRRGLFDKTIFDMFQVLTSHGIQERYIKVCKDCNRKFEIKPEYLIKSHETGGLVPQNPPLSPTKPPIKSESGTHSKVKESKIKDSPLTPQGESREGLREFLENAPEENPIGPGPGLPNRLTPKSATHPDKFSDDTWKILTGLQKMGIIWFKAHAVAHTKSGRTVGQIVDEAISFYGYQWTWAQLWDERDGYFCSRGFTGIKTPAGMGGLLLSRLQDANLQKMSKGAETFADQNAKDTASRIIAKLEAEEERKKAHA
jgi:hypothetical protein